MKGGLLNLKPDKRDFSYTKAFGTIRKLPEEDFVVAEPLKIKDQYDSDLCVAFAACAVSEDQEGVELSPEWFFSQVKKIQGSWDSWGADLRDGAKAAVRVGFLEEKHETYHIEKHDRDTIANWKEWPPGLESEALKHKKKSYFRIDT